MIVNKQKPIRIINNCKCIVDYDELRKSILWYTDKPVARIKTIYLYGNYPAVSVYEEKIHVHRLLMMYWMKKKLKFNEHVHHKDHDKLNCSKDNLFIIEASKHLSMHNEGKKLSPDHRQKISKANRLRKGIKKKKRYNLPIREIASFLQKDKSINWIANHYGVDWSTIKSRIHDNPELLKP